MTKKYNSIQYQWVSEDDLGIHYIILILDRCFDRQNLQVFPSLVDSINQQYLCGTKCTIVEKIMNEDISSQYNFCCSAEMVKRHRPESNDICGTILYYFIRKSVTSLG